MTINFYSTGNAFTEVRAELDNFRKRCYPEFVYGAGKQVPVAPPVFSFHSVHPEIFENQLSYLAGNGYRTLTADEFLGWDKQGSRAVMLTFDDGKAPLWTVAYPLLKKYGMKAVAFVMPGQTRDSGQPRKTFDGSCGESANDDILCSWAELKAMEGVIDVQSHSLLHWIIFVSQKPVCFFTPELMKRISPVDLPVLHQNGQDLPATVSPIPLGTPFYEMDSRLSDSPRFLEPWHVREALAKYVSERGGADFFRRWTWRRELVKAHKKHVRDALFRLETGEERIRNIKQCLENSRRILESRLNKRVTSLCLPFAIGGQTAMSLARSSGYKAVYWGVNAPRDTEMRQEGLGFFTRIKDDFIYRLPGKGRRSLLRILAGKSKRRLMSAMTGRGVVR